MQQQSTSFDFWLRPGRSGVGEIRRDVCWLLGLGLLLFASGLGWRDPWPADEPRFALIARDMVRTGQWLIPSVGGDLYADKPPIFFWLIAGFLTLTQQLRVAFLLPSLLASVGCVLLIYDLARRLWTREIGFAAALALTFTWQFAWQARQAQIDATECFFTTLGLYGLLRHLLLAPAWHWYVIGWAAAGLGVITKGVGFLPLLVLIPYALLPKWRSYRVPGREQWKWLLGPVGFIAATGVWLAPMLLASLRDPAIAAYRNEILFHQTVGRYAHAWHHYEPAWYFIVNVIPGLWLPLTALLPWLVPRWRIALRARDLRIALPLAWIVLVVIFFSASAGKRGVYVLPAVPAFALICAPWLAELARNRGSRITIYLVAIALALAMTIVTALLWTHTDLAHRLQTEAGADLRWFATALAVCCVLVCVIAGPGLGFPAFASVLTASFVLLGFWGYPLINSARSGEHFVRQVQMATRDVAQLGLVAYKEQYLLQFDRPTFNFGHARWREGDQEAADAAAWLYAGSGRALLIDDDARKGCFPQSSAQSIAQANGEQWFVVRQVEHNACVARGEPARARRYDPLGDPDRHESDEYKPP